MVSYYNEADAYPHNPAAQPPSQPPPLSETKTFRPYYAPIELARLVRLQAGGRGDGKAFSETRVEGWRQLACGYIERVGSRLGFPRRTIATAQTMYHRFHLHLPLRHFAYHDVSLAALLVSSKLEDTLKKLREIQIAGWQVVNLLEGGPGTGEGDVPTQEAQRPHLIAIERLILQTICFNFNLHRSPFALENSLTASLEVGVSGRDVFGWVIRLGRAMDAPKAYVFLSHLLAIDVHRTLTPLSYPPHTVALACIYLTSFLLPGHPNCIGWQEADPIEDTLQSRDYGAGNKRVPAFGKDWCRPYESVEEDVEEISHAILNLFIQLCPPPPLSNSTNPFGKPSPTYSPSSLTSPSEPALINARSGPSVEREKHVLLAGIPHALSGQVVVSARRESEFTRIKIRLREIGQARERDREADGKRVGKTKEGSGRKRTYEATAVEDEDGLGVEDGLEKRMRAERWVGGAQGMVELAELEGAAEAKALDPELMDDEEGSKKPVSVRYRF